MDDTQISQLTDFKEHAEKINKKQSYKNIKCLAYLTNETFHEMFHELLHTFLPTLFQVIYIDKVIIQRVVLD
jgi:hypothetical protein